MSSKMISSDDDTNDNNENHSSGIPTVAAVVRKCRGNSIDCLIESDDGTVTELRDEAIFFSPVLFQDFQLRRRNAVERSFA
jgi:hypothetical protein